MTDEVLAIRHVGFEDLGLLEPLLTDRGYQIRYLEAGVEPITVEAVLRPQLLIVLGGPIGVYETDSYPFLVDERNAVAARLSAGKATLGVCLGAQLIAAALGAEVRPTGGKEIGYGPLTLTAEGRQSVLGPLDGVPVLHWHGDEFANPEVADRLAETPGFPNQAFSVGSTVLGLQFHIEADSTRLEQWLIGHANELAAAGVDPRRLRADAASYGPQLATVASGVVRDWLDGMAGA
ncbi:MAG TPA: glutamine amidotransferase [Propionibacteriaceae bacterium]|nr:glutamine amidotransferase [Propionibacteriaceae bacterium]